jgi:uncharacterized repeat protein (TIGR03803 family)
MRRKKFLGRISEVLASLALMLILSGGATAGTYEILHVFRWAKNPTGSLTFDGAGNLYGTTALGGGHNCGIVFKLHRNPNLTSTYSILYGFKGGTEGCYPTWGVIFDAAGNLYGVTQWGGSGSCSNGSLVGCGFVFKLKPNPDGTWSESVLYSFTGGADGSQPANVRLVFDSAGNLYGTTSGGGAYNYGTVFELKPQPDGTWTENVLHSFDRTDGENPLAGLIFDAAGRSLYGTTFRGGAGGGPACGEPSGCGTVFKLTPNSSGTWTESVLYRFTGGADGATPSNLIFDSAGNLYGTTVFGGGGSGVAFRLAPNPDGTWAESVLYTFAGGGDGGNPMGGLTFDVAGVDLYGTTFYGGTNKYGLVFKLSPSSGGWTETVLYSFVGYGRNPQAPVIFDPSGNLYGTTTTGSNNYGLVFEITP